MHSHLVLVQWDIGKHWDSLYTAFTFCISCNTSNHRRVKWVHIPCSFCCNTSLVNCFGPTAWCRAQQPDHTSARVGQERAAVVGVGRGISA